MKKTIVSSLKKKNVYFLKKLPSFSVFHKCLNQNFVFFICDRQLKPIIQPWCKREWIYFVQAGEQLKNIDHFSSHVRKIAQKISKSAYPPEAFVSMGGGSVSDFTGFFASLYKRGKPVIHVPTTLLSALDASHGGKTAMNAFSIKNLLGTYHFPQKVFIVQNLIHKKKQEILSAYGELVKIAFIEGDFLYKKLTQKNKISFEHIWSLIPYAIKTKLDIVEKDPFEKKGLRRQLNLGHSLGHVLETALGMTHGQAVALGTRFAVLWSVEKKWLSPQTAQKLLNMLYHYTDQSLIPALPVRTLKKLIQEDKKVDYFQKINFVFLKNLGQPIIKKVSIDELICFYKKLINIQNKKLKIDCN